MAYTSHLNASVSKRGSGGSSGGGKGNTSPTLEGRVAHVVLSLDDPYCDHPDMINGVYIRSTEVPQDENDIRKLPFVYQGSASNRTLPLVKEIVSVYAGASPASLDNPGNPRLYWKEVVNVWNHPHHNAAPETLQDGWQENLLAGFPEQKTINPLQANPGDTLIEGRLGQSIRFGGSKGVGTLIDADNEGKPVTIISNGQKETTNGSDLILEDVNEDANSIYLVSDHTVPLKPSNTLRGSYDVPPIKPEHYRGNQVVVNGGRLYFNAKEDSVLISARESIGLNAKTLNLDATEYVCIEGKTILLGAKARTAPLVSKQPVIKGLVMQNWAYELLDALQNVSSAMIRASAVNGGPVTSLIEEGAAFRVTLGVLRANLNSILSNKVYVE